MPQNVHVPREGDAHAPPQRLPAHLLPSTCPGTNLRPGTVVELKFNLRDELGWRRSDDMIIARIKPGGQAEVRKEYRGLPKLVVVSLAAELVVPNTCKHSDKIVCHALSFGRSELACNQAGRS